MVLDEELARALEIPFANDIDHIQETRKQQAELTTRAQFLEVSQSINLTWWDELIGGTDHFDEVPIRIYKYKKTSEQTGALLFFHGGAFVFGDLESEHERCLRIAEGAACLVVSVGYRLAPEFPFPAALEDGSTALSWLIANAQTLGVDTGRIGVSGASAGGALAAGLTLRMRDNGDACVRALLLIYPALDDRADTPSMRQYFRHEPWDGERTQKMWKIYLNGTKSEISPYAAPSRAEDLSGLPPTYIMTAEEDPLRDEAHLFAMRLLEFGVSVEYRHFPRTFHGFDTVAPRAALSDIALTEQIAFVRRELGTFG